MRDRRTHILGRSAHPPLLIRIRRRRNHHHNQSPWQSQCRPFHATAAHRITAVHIRQWRCRNRTTTTPPLLCLCPSSTSTGSFRAQLQTLIGAMDAIEQALEGAESAACS